jgi:hypothetical protein
MKAMSTSATGLRIGVTDFFNASLLAEATRLAPEDPQAFCAEYGIRCRHRYLGDGFFGGFALAFQTRAHIGFAAFRISPDYLESVGFP